MFLTPEQKGLNQQQIDEICERLWKEEQGRSTKECHDCGAKPGEKHLDGCDVARCKSCGGQRLSCDCENPGEDVWTGVWPGIKECYEQKLICFDTCMGLDRWCFDLNVWYANSRK